VRHSVRQKLTFWYLAVLAGTLILFASVLYASVAVSLVSDLDKKLVLSTDGLISSIIAFQEAEKTAGESSAGNWQRAPFSPDALHSSYSTASELIKRWAGKTGLLREDGQMVCLMDHYGQVIVTSPSFQKAEKSFQETRIDEVIRRQTLYRTVRTPEGRFRVITRPAIQYNRVRYLVQTAVPLSPVDDSLRQLRVWMFWLIPLMLMVAGTGGFSLAARTLHPLDRITAQTSQFSMETIDKRLDVPKTEDELQHLAEVFNELLDRVERTFRRQRQFSAAASHELRTPLTVMKGELEVTLRKPRAPEEYQQALRTHLQAIDEMTTTVEGLLLLARTEASQASIDWRPVDLAALVHGVSGTWQKVAGSKEVRIELFAKEPVWVRGEQRLLERLLSNLLDNAIRHTPAGKTISIRADYWRDKATLIVQDSGPGIPAAELPGIFERFFTRPAPGQESNPHSTGLGLGLCRWIAEAHHGRIEVASPTGQGTLFTLWLPLITKL